MISLLKKNRPELISAFQFTISTLTRLDSTQVFRCPGFLYAVQYRQSPQKTPFLLWDKQRDSGLRIPPDWLKTSEGFMIGFMSSNTYNDFLEFAAGLASTASLFALNDWQTAEPQIKADGSEVTNADLRIQRMVFDRIRAVYPEHSLLGEEEGEYLADMPPVEKARYCWVVDPLDGTRNYVRGFPDFCISIALLDQGIPAIGIIRHHVTGKVYSAVKNKGAFSGKRKMDLLDHPLNQKSVLTFQPDDAGEMYETAEDLLRKVYVRNLGSTALHLAMLADNNVDGSICKKSHLWDIAAGALLIEEAGGKITDLAGTEYFPFDLSKQPTRDTPFVAGPPLIHNQLLETMRA